MPFINQTVRFAKAEAKQTIQEIIEGKKTEAYLDPKDPRPPVSAPEKLGKCKSCGFEGLVRDGKCLDCASKK